VTADELLGLKPVNDESFPKAPRLPKRPQGIADLPAADQRIALKLVMAPTEARRHTKPRAGARGG